MSSQPPPAWNTLPLLWQVCTFLHVTHTQSSGMEPRSDLPRCDSRSMLNCVFTVETPFLYLIWAYPLIFTNISMLHYGHKEMDMVISNTQLGCEVLTTLNWGNFLIFPTLAASSVDTNKVDPRSHVVVTSSYFSCCCLSVISVCPFPSDLWHQPVVLPKRTKAHWIYNFCEVQIFKIAMWENPSRLAVCEIPQPACLTATMPFDSLV